MGHRRKALAVLVSLLCAGTIAQTPPDLYDYVLVGYELSPAQSAQFSDTDGRLSPFWEEWDAQNEQSLTLDYLHMYSGTGSPYWWPRSTLCFQACTEPHDAQMTVRAAYDDSGVYLYFRVRDNSWVQPEVWGNDVIDVYIDTLSSQEIWMQTPLLVFPVAWASITYSSCSIQSGFLDPPFFSHWCYGDEEPPGVLCDTPPCPEYVSPLRIEIVAVDDTIKGQEWLIPWANYGSGGLDRVPPNATLLGLVLGYNDTDADSPGETDRLRWKNLCDPYCGQTVDTWGDLEISGIALGETAVRNPRVRIRSTRADANRIEYFSLTGQKLRSSAGASGIVIGREMSVMNQNSIVRVIVR